MNSFFMRILQRKGSYYLQHSFRKNNKVITRELHLGEKLPENIEDIKKDFLQSCRKEAFYDVFEKIKTNFQKEWASYPQSIQKKVLQQFAVDFTYNTNAIEGSTITLNETRELVDKKVSPNKPLADVLETQKHAQLFQKILEEKTPRTMNALLSWHKKLFVETKPDIAGKTRDYLVRVHNYVAPDWQDLDTLLKEFVLFWKKPKNMHPIEHAARAHYRFEKIHPFGDGNGRMGRLIMNELLWNAKHPLLIIEYKKRISYYKALSRDEEYFVQYFMRRYLSTHKKYWK